MKLNTVEKWGGSAAALMAVIALCGYFHPVVSALGIATTESVDAKIATAVEKSMADIRADLNEWHRDDTEFWIQFLDFKANRGEANDFDMTLLAAKLRQREELLKK